MTEQPTSQTDANGEVIPLEEDPLTEKVKAERITPPDTLGCVMGAVQTSNGLLLSDNSTTIYRFAPEARTWTETELMIPYLFAECKGVLMRMEM